MSKVLGPLTHLELASSKIKMRSIYYIKYIYLSIDIIILLCFMILSPSQSRPAILGYQTVFFNQSINQSYTWFLADRMFLQGARTKQLHHEWYTSQARYPLLHSVPLYNTSDIYIYIKIVDECSWNRYWLRIMAYS